MEYSTHTNLEFESVTLDSLNYLLKYFNIKNVGFNLTVVDEILPGDVLGRFRVYDEKLPFYRIAIDEGKIIKKAQKGKVEDKLNFLLDNIIGEEMGHFLFYLGHKEMHHNVSPEDFKATMFAQQVIGNYCGVTYANRNFSEPLLLKPDKEVEAYSLANKLYREYKDAKLAGLCKVKSLDEFNCLIEDENA